MESLLKQQVQLNDGSFDNVFSKFDRDGQVFFDCFVCRVGRLPGLINATVHARGKRHIKNLQNMPDARSYRDKIADPVKILPEQSSSSFGKSTNNSKEAMIDTMNLHMSARSIEQKAYAKHKSAMEYDRAKKSLEDNYARYKKTLDSHPRYAEEWKTFWERKYKEVKKEGKNPADYDYKPEWIKYWRKRIDDLMNEDLAKLKRDILKIEDNIDFSSRRRSRTRSRSRSRSISPVRKRPRSRSPRRRRSPSRSPPKFRRNSRSPDYKYSSSRPAYSPPRERSRDRMKPRASRREGPVEISSEEDETSFKPAAPSLADEKISFIGVCRLLSALESDVGSLAPKVLDLLTKSLQVEKIQPSKCDEIMMTRENAVLLETVKEKLKGTLGLGILTNQKETAIKLAVQKIAKLLHLVPVTENGSRQGESSDLPKKVHMRQRWIEVLQSMGKSVSDQELDVLVEMLDEEVRKNEEQHKLANIVSFEKVAEKIAPQVSSDSNPPPASTNFEEKDKPFSKEFEDLSDEDLKLLLSNFSDLEIEEQTHMVNFLTYLEKTDPERVKALKSCVNLDNEADDMIEDNDVELLPVMKPSLTDNLLNFNTTRRR